MNREPHQYYSVVVSRASEKAAAWFEQKLRAIGPDSFFVTYAGAGRRLGDSLIQLTREERAGIEAAKLPVPEAWRLCDVGRGLLLLRACEGLQADQQPAFIAQVFNKGDNKEREALLKSLMMLPEPERFATTAIDACRSHVQSVFEAIACDNAYPGSYFPDAAFNQMVMKAFFTQVRVERIVLLAQRRSPELTRMAHDYADERRAAGRSVPSDLELATVGS